MRKELSDHGEIMIDLNPRKDFLPKSATVLGSTGSIGTQTLEVVDITKQYEVEALSAHSNVALMEQQIRKYKPKKVSMTDENAAKDLKVRVSDTPVTVLSGIEGTCECAAHNDVDTVVTAIVGIAGLKPTMSAISCGKRITASGGPFFGKDKEFLENVTPEMALKHPNWSMGAKITIDSATLVNKGLEIIEAMHLFDISVDNVQPIIHRESIIHSMVEFCDGSIIAQMGVADMKLPISYALSYPDRTLPVTKPLNLAEITKLTFFDVDNENFPAISLAKKAAKDGEIMCAVYNGANEAAVELFLNGKCKFTQITQLIEKAMERAPKIANPSLEDIFSADAFARQIVKECC